MTWRTPILWISLVLSASFVALAAPARVEAQDVDDDDDDDEWEDEDDEEASAPSLRAPSVGMPDVGGLLDDDEDEDEDDGAADESTRPSRSAADDDAERTRTLVRDRRTASPPIIRMRGYMRTRGELWNNFSMGRSDGPFGIFRAGTADVAAPSGGCGSDPTTGMDAERCGGNERLRFANVRLRLQPTLAISDDVQLHATFDVFDNLVLGSTPDGYAYRHEPGGFSRTDRVPGVPLDTFTTGQNPPQDYRNSLRHSLYVRHVWAEVTNRTLGTLRFGRMPAHWGLGIVWNEGAGIDGDFSSDVDRVQFEGEIFGIRLSAAYDFAAQGVLRAPSRDWSTGILFDATPQDDLRQFNFNVSRRISDEAREARLAAGGWVLEGGLDFTYRRQLLSSASTTSVFPTDISQYSFIRRDFRTFVPDLWGRFLWRSLRLEVEIVGVGGRVANVQNDVFVDDGYKIRQLGVAFEGEYRLLRDKLALRLYTGYATGDPDVDGLSDRENTLTQVSTDSVLSHFGMHPNYRVDLILWRNMMGRVGGAWYLRPGVHYDVIKTAFGQQLSAGLDVIYSRAAQEVQTYGADPNLGLELDATIAYSSEDGPRFLDGFNVLIQYGVLFPFQGLAFVEGNRPMGFSLRPAHAARLILGVRF